MIHGELAIVKDNGIRNDYRVNFELVNTKSYHDKFVGLTEHKALDEAIYKRAAKMLEHRSGTEYEDIAMLDVGTGKIIVENDRAGGDFKHKCGLSNIDANYLDTSKKKFEILHNHPGSSIPSTADIEGLFLRENAVGSTIVCHDGTVYRMKKLKSVANIDVLIEQMMKNICVDYPNYSDDMREYQVVINLIKYLERKKLLNILRGEINVDRG